MKHLLDVNVLLASVWTTHPQHAAATAWLPGKAVVVCPISELGFLRISTQKKAFNLTMADARTGLESSFALKAKRSLSVVTSILSRGLKSPAPSSFDANRSSRCS